MSAIGRIVVTGATGFIGRRLVRHLVNSGCEVAQWSRPAVDLVDPESVANAMRTDEPAVIFHLAAAGVSGAHAHDSRLVGRDVAMTANLIDQSPSDCRIILAGSMSEYGRAGTLLETQPCLPRTAYGIAKLASGLYARAYGAAKGQVIRNCRLFGVYGPGEASYRLFPTLIDALRSGRQVDMSDGLQQRDFIHIDDACRAMMAIALCETAFEIVNVGTGVPVRVRDAATWIAQAIDVPTDRLRFGVRERSPGDEDMLVANVDRLGVATGWIPPQRLSPGLSLSLFTDELS